MGDLEKPSGPDFAECDIYHHSRPYLASLAKRSCQDWWMCRRVVLSSNWEIFCSNSKAVWEYSFVTTCFVGAYFMLSSLRFESFLLAPILFQVLPPWNDLQTHVHAHGELRGAAGTRGMILPGTRRSRGDRKTSLKSWKWPLAHPTATVFCRGAFCRWSLMVPQRCVWVGWDTKVSYKDAPGLHTALVIFVFISELNYNIFHWTGTCLSLCILLLLCMVYINFRAQWIWFVKILKEVFPDGEDRRSLDKQEIMKLDFLQGCVWTNVEAMWKYFEWSHV